MKYLDTPPVHLLLCIWAAWLQARSLPIGRDFIGPVNTGIGIVLVIAGALLVGFAVLAMRQVKTTVSPHSQPTALVKSGPFSFTRNPIYLGDVLILLGAILWLGALISLILVPLFVLLIERRFIIPEEERLRAAFGEEFEAYTVDVKRWI